MDNIFLLKRFSINYLSKFNSSKNNLERVLRNKIRKMNLKKKEKFILYDSIAPIINELESKNIINDKTYADSKIYSFSLQGKSKIFVKNYEDFTQYNLVFNHNNLKPQEIRRLLSKAYTKYYFRNNTNCYIYN